MAPVLRRWLALAAGLLAIAAFVAAAKIVSPKLPGPAGVVFKQNMDQDIETSALFYSEVTNIREFFAKDGRYGRMVYPPPTPPPPRARK